MRLHGYEKLIRPASEVQGSYNGGNMGTNCVPENHKTWQEFADSFSEGMFQLSLTWLNSIYMIQLVVCEI